jgi:hypothetical protein
VHEYGFEKILSPSASAWADVQYRKTDVTVDVGWEKGNLLVMIGTTRETPTLRPYTSRYFDLSRIALKQDKRAFHDLTDAIKSDAEAQAKYLVQKLRRYGHDILSGDLHMLEELFNRT